MPESQKEILQESWNNSQEVLKSTKKSLSILEKETRINFFKNIWNWLKNIFTPKKARTTYLSRANYKMKQKYHLPLTPQITENEKNEIKSEKNTEESKENAQTWSDKISDEMFEQLLKMEWKHEKGGNTLVAWVGKQFWEKFATWPYGMVYKHIDENGNLLKKPVQFKAGEEVNADWALKNARACYDKRAKERKEDLEKKWHKYTQNELDSLVSTCGWTKKSSNSCRDFVLANWNDKNKVIEYIRTHSTTAAWNGKVMPGLVRRREFEAGWFSGIKKTFAEYKVKNKKTKA